MRAVEAHSWPGNVRELSSCIKRASIMADGSQITSDDLGLKAVADEEGENPFDLRAARDAAEETHHHCSARARQRQHRQGG